MTRSLRIAGRAAAQRGVVLFVALIVLVIMSLAAVVIARSVLTGNRVAGNVAFQQAATASAERGVETATAWLEANVGPALNNSIAAAPPGIRYLALRQDPDIPTNQSWEEFWQTQLLPFVNTLPADAAGNTVDFVIQRMCNAVGDPTTGVGCSSSPVAGSGAATSSKGSGVIALLSTGQVYYRVTVRVAGPRNAVSFVQAIVAL